MNDGFIRYFGNSEYGRKYSDISDFYDQLYASTNDHTWEKIAGRGADFIAYVGALVSQFHPERYLDVGCGEGQQIHAVEAGECHGFDLSAKALTIALERNPQAILSVACAEEMPFPDGCFNVVSSIGVMTHFLGDVKATQEIHRVLRPDGKYILGVFIRPIFSEKCRSFIREYCFPNFRFGLILKKCGMHLKSLTSKECNATTPRADKQPMERMYTPGSLKGILAKTGFKVDRMITKWTHPEAPLSGPHFRIYILSKHNSPV